MSSRLKQGYHHHHVISIMDETHHQATITVITIMAPRHHIAWDPTTCINEDCEDIRHHQVISNKAPPSPRAPSIIKASPTWLHHLQGLHHQQASSRHPTGLHHIKQAPSPSAPSTIPSRSSMYLQGSMNIIYKHRSSFIIL